MTKPRAHTGERAADAKPLHGGAPGGVLSRSDLPHALAAALDAAVDKHGKAPTILRVTEIAGYTDWVLIVSARNERQVAAIADAVAAAARAAGAKVRGVEGTGEHLWDLLDFDDFMVHVFFHPVRTHYDLESMWSDASRVELGLPADVMDTSELESLALPDVLPTYRGDATFGGFDDEFGDAPETSGARARLPPRLRPRAPQPEAGDSIVAGHVGDDALGEHDFGEDDDDDFADDDLADDDDDFAEDDDVPDDAPDDDFAEDDDVPDDAAPAAAPAAGRKPRTPAD